MLATCADPQSFFRGGPTLTTFFFFFFCKSTNRKNSGLIIEYNSHSGTHRNVCVKLQTIALAKFMSKGICKHREYYPGTIDMSDIWHLLIVERCLLGRTLSICQEEILQQVDTIRYMKYNIPGTR